MQVPEDLDYKLLNLLGDAQPHTWLEIVYLGVHYLQVDQSRVEKLLKRAAEYQWIFRSEKAPILRDDTIELSYKGDQYLRYMAIRRGGEVSYYKYFNRSLDSHGFGDMGLDKFAPLPSKLEKVDLNAPTNESTSQ